MRSGEKRMGERRGWGGDEEWGEKRTGETRSEK
jgi:hypothetical protein